MEMKAFLNHLKHVKEQANGSYMACCPSHDDHNPSLSIGHLLVYHLMGKESLYIVLQDAQRKKYFLL